MASQAAMMVFEAAQMVSEAAQMVVGRRKVLSKLMQHRPLKRKTAESWSEAAVS